MLTKGHIAIFSPNSWRQMDSSNLDPV